MKITTLATIGLVQSVIGNPVPTPTSTLKVLQVPIHYGIVLLSTLLPSFFLSPANNRPLYFAESPRPYLPDRILTLQPEAEAEQTDIPHQHFTSKQGFLLPSYHSIKLQGGKDGNRTC
jgi:hypothetical protein